MENKYREKRIRRIGLYAAVFTLTTAMLVLLWLFSKERMLNILLSAGLFCVFILFVCADRVWQNDTDRMLCALSDLIDSLMNQSGTPVFPETQDSLLSKLQSQVRKLSNILRLQNETILKEKDEIKTLISDIAHQMKTPVATVRMFGELLSEENISIQERCEYTETLLAALDKLCFLTESVIKMSRLESGIIALKPEPLLLNDLVLEAVKQVFQKAKSKNIEIVLEEEKEVLVLADANWTREAVFNILDNAVKYTPEDGKITIRLYMYELFAGIDISDTGMGISEEEKEKIFGRFYRGTRAGSAEGIGIGLYIAREIIAGQGGYIKVRSEQEKGSTFTVLLPRCHK